MITVNNIHNDNLITFSKLWERFYSIRKCGVPLQCQYLFGKFCVIDSYKDYYYPNIWNAIERVGFATLRKQDMVKIDFKNRVCLCQNDSQVLFLILYMAQK